VLVGTDGSSTAGRAVARAVAVASVCGAHLVVAFVGDTATGRTVLGQVVEEHGGGAVTLDTRLLDGDPADALLGLAGAERIDLMIVGSKGMSGARRFLLGSVPNKVSHQAGCDVLVVHTTGAAG
jgi:nucleotide-binding universal stress UspA family protein